MTQFLDADTYSGGAKEGLTFQQIVLFQVSRITRLQSVEFTGGYWNSRARMMGGVGITEKYYIPDSRDQFINATNNLHDVLNAHFDETAAKEIQAFEEDRQALVKKLDAEYASKQVSAGDAKNEKADFHRKLLRILCRLLKRLGYLEGTVFEETV